jgi:hypothetical protein
MPIQITMPHRDLLLSRTQLHVELLREIQPYEHLKEREQPLGPSRALSTEHLPEIPAPPTTSTLRPPSRARTLSIDPLVPASTFDERFSPMCRIYTATILRRIKSIKQVAHSEPFPVKTSWISRRSHAHAGCLYHSADLHTFDSM